MAAPFTPAGVPDPNEPTFAEVGESYVVASYTKGRRAKQGREDRVRTEIAQAASMLFARGVTHLSQMDYLVHEGVLDEYAGVLAATSTGPRSTPGAWMSLSEAEEKFRLSASTLKRRLGDGSLPRARKDRQGYWQVCEGDLYDAGLPHMPARAGRKATNGHAQGTLTNFNSTLKKVLAHGVNKFGIVLAYDPASVIAPASRVAKRPVRGTLTLATTARIAPRLHVVQQATMWILRILGLREGEGFGIRLIDFTDFGDFGVIRIARQGGRNHPVRQENADGSVSRVLVPAVEWVKTPESERVVIVPKSLLDLIRVLIDVFHTRDGVIDPYARLIPGLAEDDTAGAGSFYMAFRLAATAEGIMLPGNLDMLFGGPDTVHTGPTPTPQDMRAGSVTDLTWAEVSELASKLVHGHIAGGDVHYRNYLHADEKLRPQHEAADAMQAAIEADIPGGLLMVPTTISCTTGSQKALARRRDEIDHALRALGWLYTPGAQADGDVLCTPAMVAKELKIEVVTARRMLQDGRIPSHVVKVRGHGKERRARMADVLAIKAERAGKVTLKDLAAELDISYHRLYNWVAKRHLAMDKDGRDAFVPEATQTELRAMAAREAELAARGQTVPQVCQRLGLDPLHLEGLIRHGELEVIAEHGPDNARYLTCASIEAYEVTAAKMAARAARSARRKRAADPAGGPDAG